MDARRGGSTSDSSSDAGEADAAEQRVLFRKSSSLASSLSGDVGIYEDEEEDGDNDLEIEVHRAPASCRAQHELRKTHSTVARRLPREVFLCLLQCRMRFRSVASMAPLLHKQTDTRGAHFSKKKGNQSGLYILLLFVKRMPVSLVMRASDAPDRVSQPSAATWR